MCLSKSFRHMWHLEMSVQRRKNAHRTFSGLEPNFHSDFYQTNCHRDITGS